MESKELLSGNEAIARGAWEAGVSTAFGYPGTPSTEILENISAFKNDLYCEWSPNEKVAFEAAAGASFAGARTIITMKHVGLNVAADPLMTLSYIGVEGGMLICVADDPGQHSSQNEQDSRNYARFAQIPVFEPSDSQEALSFVKLGLDLSEKYNIPVMLRTTTRVSHSKSIVVTGERRAPNAVHFERNPERFVPIPVWSRVMRVKLDEKVKLLSAEASASPANRIEWKNKKRGFIAEGIAYQYLREVFPDDSVLKLGFAFPYPDDLIRTFADGVEELIIIEENDTFLEEHVKSLGIKCRGRDIISGIGELSVPKIMALKAALDGKSFNAPLPVSQAADLPSRPPVLCPGCPHRGLFHALTKHDVIVTGDIGCYSLGVFPPLSRTDTILCMGGGFSVAQGLDKANEKRRVVGIVGDSTFFHSGITGLLDIVYNKGRSVLVVLDNRTTAMTGHQEHPGTGRTLMGEETTAVSIEAVGKACGMKDVVTINPYNLKETASAVSDALSRETPSLIVTRAPCPLRVRKNVGPRKRIISEKCKSCFACVRLGCPAIEAREKGKPPVIDQSLCSGCSLCQQVCTFNAIEQGEDK